MSSPSDEFCKRRLSQNNYRFNEAATADEAFRVVQDPIPDLVILDLGLPDMDGQEVLSKLREWYSGPILILSAREQEAQKVCRIRSRCRRLCHEAVRYRGVVSPRAFAVCVGIRPGSRWMSRFRRLARLLCIFSESNGGEGREPVHLTPLEYKLLTVFLKHPQKLLTHRYLLEHVWGPGNATELHYVRVFVANLRRKLELDPSRPIHFLTEPGIGYRFVP